MSGSALTAILYHWHAGKHSEAAEDTFFRPLAPYVNVQTRSFDWFERLPDDVLADPNPLVFFYTIPPFAQLRESGRPVVWIPMWDGLRRKSQSFWAQIPPNVRVVAFSDAVAQRTRALGLDTLCVRYFCDPVALSPAGWTGERVAFYWNRNGLVSPEFLRHWCDTLSVDRLIFKPDLDPLVDPRAHFDLPTQLGRTRVEVVPWLDDREDFFEHIAPANLVLAPRAHEGIGLTFLEAMARGCAVFAHDGPTMNEYIESGRTGYLFGTPHQPLKEITDRVRDRLRRQDVNVPFGARPFYLPDAQPWDAISRLDLSELGAHARDAHFAGHAAWAESIPQYAAFLIRE